MASTGAGLIGPGQRSPCGPQRRGFSAQGGRRDAGTPAAKAGLSVGDVIVAVDGKSVTGADDLVVLTTEHKIGQTVTLLLVRAETRRSVQVMLGKDPND